jgi:hypothetical protein
MEVDFNISFEELIKPRQVQVVSTIDVEGLKTALKWLFEASKKSSQQKQDDDKSLKAQLDALVQQNVALSAEIVDLQQFKVEYLAAHTC